MTMLRSAAFNLLFYGWTAALAVAYLPFLVLPRRRLVRAGELWCRGTLWLLSATVGLGHAASGREHVPAGAAIFAVKHQSAWDTIALPLLIDDPAIVVKRELMWIPLFGLYLRKLGMIAVDRGGGAAALRRMIADATRALAAGRSVVVFPEGTRTAPGAGGAYQPGIAALYRALARPVVPVALNSGLYWGRRRFVKRPGTIAVRFLAPIAPGLDRAAFMAVLADRIETAARDLLGPPGTVENISGTT